MIAEAAPDRLETVVIRQSVPQLNNRSEFSLVLKELFKIDEPISIVGFRPIDDEDDGILRKQAKVTKKLNRLIRVSDSAERGVGRYTWISLLYRTNVRLLWLVGFTSYPSDARK